MDLDFVSVHKHAKKELGQYPAILTSHLVNNPYVLTSIVIKILINRNIEKLITFMYSFYYKKIRPDQTLTSLKTVLISAFLVFMHCTSVSAVSINLCVLFIFRCNLQGFLLVQRFLFLSDN